MEHCQPTQNQGSELKVNLLTHVHLWCFQQGVCIQIFRADNCNLHRFQRLKLLCQGMCLSLDQFLARRLVRQINLCRFNMLHVMLKAERVSLCLAHAHTHTSTPTPTHPSTHTHTHTLEASMNANPASSTPFNSSTSRCSASAISCFFSSFLGHQ